jgi:hypothetical protein
MRRTHADLNHIFTIFLSVILMTLFASSTCLADSEDDKDDELLLSEEQKYERYLEQEKLKLARKRRTKNFRYSYIDRKHTRAESMKHLAAMYGVTWVVYPLTQPKVVRDKGSWKKYKRNFCQLVFDKDEPFWNWFVHPISGSQLYLYYRANGYNRIDSMGLAAISSTLFEFTVEIYTEPASIQDLYQTPVLGAFLGYGIENLSLYLLNSGNAIGRTIGHIINPATLFWFYEGKVQIIPKINFRGTTGLTLMAEF